MKPSLRSLALSAMFLALGLVLPFLTGQIPEIGNLLLPMHLPVLLCGLVCGWKYGLAVGFTTPLLRSALFAMPVFYPSAVSMAFELAAYGASIGAVDRLFPRKTLWSTYVSLLSAMILGRLVRGAVQWLLLGVFGNGYSFAAFWAGGVTEAIPGIILQLILIPPFMTLIRKLQAKKA